QNEIQNVRNKHGRNAMNPLSAYVVRLSFSSVPIRAHPWLNPHFLRTFNLRGVRHKRVSSGVH
ncbi:MAG: hypothetical protein KAI66_07790, partial [Lentisphaeria bacterium]|nr:hypothetical protein [Lentisphaeria bacterium]